MLAWLEGPVKVATRVTARAARKSAKTAKSTLSYVANIRQHRAEAKLQAAVNDTLRKQFNSTYVEVELIDNPGVIMRVLLDSGAALSVFSLRAVKHV
jgi:uncharacterized protein YigA (DUF484 family)